MQLFHWSMSTALKQYGHGDIIVMASSVEDARADAEAQALDYLRDAREWWFLRDGTIDPEEREEYQEWMKKLRDDLAKEPDADTTVIFIRGSE